MLRIIQSHEFTKWFTALRDQSARARIQVRFDRIEEGNFGDVKPVGEGVSELKIHYGKGYRLYFIQRGEAIVVMLAGGDKSSQQRDIKRAKELAKDWKG